MMVGWTKRCESTSTRSPPSTGLFDRLHRLILDVHPDIAITLSYKMPTYRVGKRCLHVGVWKHGLSIYGWDPGRDAGFAARHPELANDKGTIRLGPDVAVRITDAEFCDFLRATFGH